MFRQTAGVVIAGAMFLTAAPAFAASGSGGSGGGGGGSQTPTNPTVACDTVASYKQSTGASSGLILFKSTISLADPCDRSLITSIIVWVRDENTGAMSTIFSGGYNKAYTFNTQYIATPGHVYTTVVNTFRTVDGVTTYVQTDLRSVLAAN